MNRSGVRFEHGDAGLSVLAVLGQSDPQGGEAIRVRGEVASGEQRPWGVIV